MAGTRLPGQYVKRFTVTTRIATGKRPEYDDGQEYRSWERVEDLLKAVTYVGDLERLDGRWSLVLQWVDFDGNGHRVAFPHEVVDRLMTSGDKIMSEARSDRSKNAARTRASVNGASTHDC